MSQNKEAMTKLAKRVVEGYEEVHNKNYARAQQLLEPLVPMLHSETKPNIKLLAYSAIAQIGAKDVDHFLQTYEMIKLQKPSTSQEKALIKRVDELFETLMETMNEDKK
ncbi:hypothetical protein [Alkalicoccus daliensis]|uniref:HEAT repeat domain-containing protein n=1 Tax=Alkalicoccus daliensis TaxID=745820 RepID=A0A1G9ZE66_9BACI|nr:hypothetical protein [Alkalicoccus daliensis]SDN18753.1 hypothetical protein SAMN04488053_10136 [Alkalicoccus daliensis]